jgi:hypothetical protein
VVAEVAEAAESEEKEEEQEYAYNPDDAYDPFEDMFKE